MRTASGRPAEPPPPLGDNEDQPCGRAQREETPTGANHKEVEIHAASGLTSTHFPLTSMKRTQKGSDLEVTSLSRRFWPQTDNSTLQTQYWEPMGPAGVGVTVYAMDPSGSSSRQAVGHENREEPQRKHRHRKCPIAAIGLDPGRGDTSGASCSTPCSISYEASLAPKHLPSPVAFPMWPCPGFGWDS